MLGGAGKRSTGSWQTGVSESEQENKMGRRGNRRRRWWCGDSGGEPRPRLETEDVERLAVVGTAADADDIRLARGAYPP